MGVETSDRALLGAVATGDQAALGALYDRYAAPALGLAARVVQDRGAAEEVVQQSFVTIWRRAGTYRPEHGEPRAWLLSIVHHQAIDRRRGAGAAGRAVPERAALALASADGDAWTDAVRRLERPDIAAALAALPPEQREPIELAFFDGLTQVEVAARGRLPLSTVRGHLRLGLARLRGQLQRRDESSSRRHRHASAAPVAWPSAT